MDNTDAKLEVARIAEKANDDAEAFAGWVIGEKPTYRGRREIRFYDDQKLRVFVGGSKSGKWRNYADDAHGDMLDLIEYIRNCSKGDAIQAAKGYYGISDAIDLPPPKPRKTKQEEERERAEEDSRRARTASFIWRRAANPHGTPAADYLRNRGIRIERLPACVRYYRYSPTDFEKSGIDPAPFGEEGLHAALFLGTDARGEVRAVQEVRIHKGRKAEKDTVNKTQKRTLGVLDGVAVKLAMPTKEGEHAGVLIIAEGPETGLSVFYATGIATWIALGSGNLARADLPDWVRTVILAVDIEASGNGLASALKAAAVLRQRGLRVRLAIPADGDFNDVLQHDGVDAVREHFTSAVEPEVEAPADAPTVVLRDPRDALAVWLSTGFPTVATVKPLVPERHLPTRTAADGYLWPAERCVAITSIEEEPLRRERPHPEDPELRVLRLMKPAAELRARFGGAILRRLIALAPAEGLLNPERIEALALHPEGPVIVADSRRSLKAGVAVHAGRALVGALGDPMAYDWSLLAGRDVVLAPTYSPEGYERAAGAAILLERSGATRVALLRWSMFMVGEGDPRLVHPQGVPRGFDYAGALDDGWRGEHADRLLELALPLGSAPGAATAAAA